VWPAVVKAAAIRKSRCLCRIRLKFDSVAKLPECPDHSDRAHSFGLFAHRGAASGTATTATMLS
jgi:hypothetical protein